MFGPTLFQQNEPYNCRDEGQKHEDDHPTMGFRFPEGLWHAATIAARPLASAPEVTVHVILIHTHRSKTPQ
jgi:hypothetical protein